MKTAVTNQLNTPANRRTAFTMVELMVVIAIIAVLAALLLPALQSAKNRAKTVVCANNQHQIGVAINSFVNTHNGYFPYQSSDSDYTCEGTGGQVPNFIDALVPYLVGGSYTNFMQIGAATNYYQSSLQKLVRCPANPNDWTFAYFDTTSYPMNNNLFPPGMAGSGQYAPSPTSSQRWAAQARLGTFSYPSGALMIGECPVNSNTNAPDDPWTATGANYGYLPFWTYGSGNFSDTCVTNWSMHCNTPCYWAVGSDMDDHSWQWMRPDCTMMGSVFHGLNMNCLHIDGHVAQLSKATLISFTFQYECPNGTNGITTSWGYQNPAAGLKNNSPGGIFWNDGKEIDVPWYTDQYPGNAPGNFP